MNLYHYSDCAHLPYILRSGELRPATNAIGDLPGDLLFATTSSKGDRTAVSYSGRGLAAYRDGQLIWIRFELESNDFAKWEPLLIARGWTEAQRQRMRAAAARMGEYDIDKWRARADPLPLARVKTISAKSYAMRAWQPVPEEEQASVRPGREGGLEMTLLSRKVWALCEELPSGLLRYRYEVI